MASGLRSALRVSVLVLAILFLLSSAMNFGATIPLGLARLAFSNPQSSIAEFEVVIGAVLIIAAGVSRLYPYAGALLLTSVGILEGLLSSSVEGEARELHELMVPFLVAAWLILGFEARAAHASRGTSDSAQSRRGLITALQFFVGGLVTLGGAAFASQGTYPAGTTVGLVHLAVGLAGLVGGYAYLRKEPWSRSYLVAVNAATIVWSAFSETLAEVYALLPPGINDALIGTIVAIVVSAAIILMLRRRSPG